MATTKVKLNRQRLQTDTVLDIQRVIDADELKNQVGRYATEAIKFNARIGRPLNDNRSFPPLKASTEEIRKNLSVLNKTHPTFSPTRSNVTFTGQLLDALSYRPIKGGIDLFYTKARTPIIGPEGPRKTKTNPEIIKDLQKLGFIVFSKLGIENNTTFSTQIRQIIRRFIRNRL